MKPLLAASKIIQPANVELPTYASAKLDGIRCCMVDGVAMSRNEKQIPNSYVQKCLHGLHGFDGELLLKDPTKDFNDCQSAFMSQNGQPEFYFHVFDYWASALPFEERIHLAAEKLAELRNPHCTMIAQVRVHSLEALLHFYNTRVAEGHEGIICRSPNGRYKHGRSTPKEQYSVKLKPVKMEEATVIGFARLVDGAGQPQDTLGAITAKLASGKTFSIGTGEGLTAARRKEIWDSRDKYIGAQVSFQYQELSRAGVPRFPSWRGFRYD